MKTKHILILLFAACLLFVAAGCTSSSPASVPAATSAPAPTFAGKWMTTWHGGGHDIPMTLTMSGSAVTGTYEYNTGTITGTETGDRLVGTWTENEGASKGPFEFVMSGDGKTFSGWWAYEGDDFAATKKEEPSWTGARA